jgi:Methionine biosynthesis protein MetW
MSQSISLVYSHPLIYHWAIRLLYGRAFDARYQAISDLIADGSEVFEACAGDGYLYRRYLRQRPVSYRGGDVNEGFIAHAKRRNIPMARVDILEGEIPEADIVILQGSLYQFMPNHAVVVDKLLRAARRSLIISEPVRNLARNAPKAIAWFAQRSTSPGDGAKPLRFDEASLDAFFLGQYADRIQHQSLIPGGRDKLFCLRGQA